MMRCFVIFLLQAVFSIAQVVEEKNELNLFVGEPYKDLFEKKIEDDVRRVSSSKDFKSFKAAFDALVLDDPHFEKIQGILTAVFRQINTKIVAEDQLSDWEKETAIKLHKFLVRSSKLDSLNLEEEKIKRRIATAYFGFDLSPFSSNQIDDLLQKSIRRYEFVKE